MRVAVHQPDLLPWPGFWFKMVNCDRFVLAVHDQLQKHWVQRRVRMRETWVSLSLETRPHLIPINTVRVKPGWQDHLVDSIRGRYTGAPYWRERGGDVLDLVTSVHGGNLAEINHALILALRDYLGITTEVVVTDPPRHAGVDRVLEQVEMVGGTSYLSGTGARGYIDAAAEQRFRDRGIDLVWSDHHKTTGDSVVTAILDHDDPMAVIRRGGTAGSTAGSTA